MVYRDSHGRTLEDYPRPSLAVDTAVLTVDRARLGVLLVLSNEGSRTGGNEWRLPGTFLHPGERLTDAAHRALREKAGVEGLAPRQLHVFDDPDRDDRGWVVSVAYSDVVPSERLATSDRVRVLPVRELPRLLYDHAQIVEFAVDGLRNEYQRAPDPAGLLEEPFTVRRLRGLHEAVLGQRLLPDTFRRTMLPGLEPTGELFSEGRGRPAGLYRRV